MRIKVDRTLEHIYKEYCLLYGDIDKKLFKQICQATNKKITQYILDGNEVELPGLSTLSIRKKKMQFSKLHFDYAEYNRTGIKSYHLNSHSDEFYASAYWEKKRVIIKYKTLYRFNLVRDTQREIAKRMKEKNGHHIYELYKS